MDLRSALLALFATPDRGWLALLVGILLIVRELVRPGSIWPGLTGAVLAITAVVQLGTRGLPLVVSAVALTVAAGFVRPWYVPGAGAALVAMHAGRAWFVSWPAAIAGAPVVLLAAWLLRIAVRARANKMAA
jgi:membrane-bound serine protease (ClpP class)